jgi:LytS/YehU family sensor histidine kinase
MTEYTIAIPDDVDLSQHNIPSMIIQPFVENAIKQWVDAQNGIKTLLIRVNCLKICGV